VFLAEDFIQGDRVRGPYTRKRVPAEVLIYIYKETVYLAEILIQGVHLAEALIQVRIKHWPYSDAVNLFLHPTQKDLLYIQEVLCRPCQKNFTILFKGLETTLSST
jgi:hypothetical protein